MGGKTDVPVDLPDTVLVIKRPSGPQSGSTHHPRLHIPNGDYPLCGQNHDYYKEKSIKVYPPAHRDWCKNCIKKQREDYSMMREDILDYHDDNPDATPKEMAENVEGANPYTVRTVLDGEGIDPTEPEPMDGEDADAAESVSHADTADDSEPEDSSNEAVMVHRTKTGW